METTVANTTARDAVYCEDIFTDSQCLSLLIVRTLVAVIGVVGSLFLIFMMWVTRKLKSMFYRTLFFICICNTIRNLAVIPVVDGTSNSHWLCIMQAIFIQFFTWAIILWELCLTVHLFLTSIGNRMEKEIVYHAACWSGSSIFTIIPLAASKYGHAITWCWIEDAGWRIAMLYGEYMVIIAVIFALYGKVCYTVYAARVYERQSEEQQREIVRIRNDIKHMMKYPLVILAEGIVPIAFRFSNLSSSDEDSSFVFALLFVVGVILWGIPFVAVYVLDPATRGEVFTLKAHCLERMDRYRKPSERTSQSPIRRDDDVCTKNEPSRISIEPSTVFI